MSLSDEQWRKIVRDVKKKDAEIHITFAQRHYTPSDLWGFIMRESLVDYSVSARSFAYYAISVGIPVYIAVNRDGKLETFPYRDQADAFSSTGTGSSKTIVIKRTMSYK